MFVALACARRETPEAAKPADATKPKQASKTKVNPPAPQVNPTAVGAMMPAYHAKTLDGKDFDLAALRGKVVFLNLWATWCQPCRYEIPELEKMHAKYEAQGFSVVGVSLDDSGAEGVNEFVTAQRMNYPVVIDAEGVLASLFQTSVIPTSVLVDRSGKIVWTHYGLVSMEDEMLDKAL
jgi:thiol-disulfide isomerase/thioredoxin